MGEMWMMLSRVVTAVCSLSLLIGGIGTLVVYIVQKRRGRTLFRHFVLIPIFSLAVGVLLVISVVFWPTAFRTDNTDGEAKTNDTAYYDDDYNITLGEKHYIDFGYLSDPSAQSGAPIANLRETDDPSDLFGGIFGNNDVYTPLYTVANDSKSDMVTDGYYLYCEASQLAQAKAFYNDLGNYIFHVGTEEEWYESETSQLPVMDMDTQMINGIHALESGTILELRRETPDQRIVYIVPVSRDGVTEKYFELLNQNGRLFLVYSESYEYDETAYVCFKLPETLNTYLLDVLFQPLKI